MEDKDTRKAIAQRLKDARILSGLSQGQVAKKLGMHRPTITEIEAGNRRVVAEELKQFAELYDVGVNYLTGSAPESVPLDDPRLQLAARELKKLPKESLDKLLKAIAALRDEEE